MAVITDIADAVTAELNSDDFGITFTAQRLYQPLFELADMKDLHVTVVPRGVAIHSGGRSHNHHDYQIDVAVQKKFDSESPVELDPLMDLVQAVADHFRLQRLSSYPDAMWLKTENVPIYAQEHMEQLRQFTSIITFTFRVAR